MGRPARATAPSNFLAMMGSDSENELAEEQDSSVSRLAMSSLSLVFHALISAIIHFACTIIDTWVMEKMDTSVMKEMSTHHNGYGRGDRLVEVICLTGLSVFSNFNALIQA